MDTVIRAIQHIRAVPGAEVDCGIGQGQDIYLAHIHRQTLEVWDIPLMPDDWYGTEFQKYLAEVQAWVAPNELPSDYVFFLEYFAGLIIDEDDYYFAVYGIGLMSEEWYSAIKSDDGLFEEGFLKIGVLSLRKGEGRYVSFFLDLTGTIHQDCVIAIDNGDLSRAEYMPILQAPDAHADRWGKVADSFTEWLERAAATKGTFGYI